MYEEYVSVRFFFLVPPVAAFLGALADCLDGVLAMVLFVDNDRELRWE
jgi:hypothetical protein